jgi:hypothetical protein
MQVTLPVVAHEAKVQLHYSVRTLPDEWAIPEGPVPESVPHTIALDHLFSILKLWAERAGQPLFVARNLALRWLEARPSVGIDPDVCVLAPPPAEVLTLKSLCLWKPGHVAPPLSFEIVSESHPYKDYVGVHERYAALGARELVVFDPLLAGPKALGGPFLFQVWRRDPIDIFAREYAGPGPVFCETLGAWLLGEAGLLEVANDREGRQRWPTEAAYERAAKERAQAEAEQAKTAAEHAKTAADHAEAAAKRAQAEAERQRVLRVELERRLSALDARFRGEGGPDGEH